MRPGENWLMWNMTRVCNFRCGYCYFPHDPGPVKDPLPVRALTDFLDSTGRAWVVSMTGGEPLLYPGFLDICAALAENHRIGLDTNLSVDKVVRAFAERMDPARVYDVYASLHIEERERLGLKERFAASARLLLERGFNLKVNYVVHPTLVPRFEADRAWFAERGVPITPRPFKGRHEGRRFPQAYGPEVRELFREHEDAGRKMVFNFKGVPCDGGRNFLRLEPDGTVLRCAGDKTVLGNVRTGVRAHEAPLPCAVRACPCQGVNWVHMDEGQRAFVEGLQFQAIGDAPRAGSAFRAVLELDPRASNALNNLAVLAARDGDRGEAARLLAMARAIHPGHALYRANAEALDETEGAEGVSGVYDLDVCVDVIPGGEG
jgi:pyruvate-formate lyase-activating enzyme